MKMRRIDHIVLTVSDLEESTRFYHEVFDMPVLDQQSNDQLVTLRCGHQLIRLQKSDRQTELKAPHLTTGAADFCIVAGDQLEDILHHLKSYFVDIVAGPVEKRGSEGAMTSVYVHDPDNNLVEIAVYANKQDYDKPVQGKPAPVYFNSKLSPNINITSKTAPAKRRWSRIIPR